MEKFQKSQRFIVLDGMRGFASLNIMIFHLWLAPIKFFEGTPIFVDFFFVLSGFVLAPKLAQIRPGNRKKFIFDRLLRIYPMLIPVFMVIGITQSLSSISRHFANNAEFTGLRLIGAFLLLQIIWPATIYLNIPLWSLLAEWFVNVLASIFPPRKGFPTLLIVGAVLELVGFVSTDNHHHAWDLNSYSVAAGRVIVGFYLGLFLRKNMQGKVNESSLMRLLLPFVVFFCIYFLYVKAEVFVIFAAPVSYFIIKEGAGIDESKLPKYLLLIFRYLGRISYGIYVWHDVIGRLAVPFF